MLQNVILRRPKSGNIVLIKGFGLLAGAKGGAQDAKGGGGGEKPPNPANEATALVPNKV